MDALEELFLKIDLIHYLDKVNELEKIEKAIYEYSSIYKHSDEKNEYLMPLHLTFWFDYILLKEYAGGFADMVLQEPDISQDIVRKLLQCCVKALTDLCLDIGLIHVILRFSSLPSIPQLNFHSKILPKTGLFSIQGTLTSLSTPFKYMKSALFVCPEKCCEDREWIYDVTDQPKCYKCNKDRIEIKRARISGDCLFGVIMDTTKLEHFSQTKRRQGIVLEFRDDLCLNLGLSIKYNVIVKKSRAKFIVWGLQPILNLRRNELKLIHPSIENITKIIRAQCGISPWTLVNLLSSQLALSYLPLTMNIQLKTALLLSLASAHTKTPVPILGLGDCNGVMSEAAWINKQSFCPTVSLCTTLSGLISFDGEVAWLEVGPLLLASKGVLYIGNMLKPGSQQMTEIISAVESELVTLRAKDGNLSDLSLVTYPLRTAVWIQWKLNMNSFQDIRQLRTLIHTFGMPFLSDIGNDSDTVAKVIIDNAIAPHIENNTEFVEAKHLKEFLDMVADLDVEMSSSASAMIKNYFVASRRDRPDHLPVKAIKIITSLSEAHARLSLRNIVTEDDVIAVIFLYEESISNLFGKSLLIPQPKRAINASNAVDYCQMMDVALSEFSSWLDLYIKTLASSETTDAEYCCA